MCCGCLLCAFTTICGSSKCIIVMLCQTVKRALQVAGRMVKYSYYIARISSFIASKMQSSVTKNLVFPSCGDIRILQLMVCRCLAPHANRCPRFSNRLVDSPEFLFSCVVVCHCCDFVHIGFSHMLLSLQKTCLSQESCWLIAICCCDLQHNGVLLPAPEFRNNLFEAGGFLADFLHNGRLLLSFPALWWAAALLLKLRWQDLPCWLSVFTFAYSWIEHAMLLVQFMIQAT